MSWFEEQIDSRRRSDQEALDEAYQAAVNAIIGESFSFDAAEDELTTIQKFYRISPVKLPEGMKDENEKLTALCRLTGLMQRPVSLDEDWYRYAFGAYLCRRSDNGEYVAVLPGKMGGYSYYDRKNHTMVKLNRRNASNLQKEAIVFYKPLPDKTLGIGDVVKFGLQSWAISDIIWIILAYVVTTGVGLILPKLNYFLYSSVLEQKSITLLVSTIVFILSASISTLLLNSIRSVFISRITVRMSSAVESAAMMRILSLPVNFFRNYTSGELVNRISYLQTVCTQLVSIAFSTSLTALFSLAYITQMFNFAPALVIPSLCIVVVNLIFSIYSTLRQIKITTRQMEKSAYNNGKAVEMVSGIQKIKMAGAEARAFARYTKSFAEEAQVIYNPPLFNKYNTVISSAILLVGTLVLYAAAVKSGVSVAEYYAFQSAYGMLCTAINALSGVAIQAASMKPSLEMIRPILETLQENEGELQVVDRLSGNIEISNISFRYDDKGPDIIRDFSLRIKAGQYVAIVGRTGCGKSTLIRLLLGFEKPQKGSIYYDGRDLNLIEKRSLRQKIGTVMQDDRLFSGDIYSNIVICAPTLNLDSAWEAAEIAGVAEDIRNMPMGMHTLVTDGSGGISGGQRQRIAIARAVAPKPGILIFDEATSALDNITQAQVAQALDSLKCTRIVIAHRLSTIRHCDRIVVMDGGRIIEDGTYEELVERKGFFAELVERQRLDK